MQSQDTTSYKLFRSPDGSAIAYGRYQTDPLLVSENGSDFVEVAWVAGYSGRLGGGHEAEEFSLRRLDDDGVEGPVEEVVRNDSILAVGSRAYFQVDTPERLAYKPLPDVRRPEYLFEFADGEVLYFDASTHHYSYESIRCFRGTYETLRPVEITGPVWRQRDGGTTQIPTAEGTLYSPAMSRRERLAEMPTWTDGGGIVHPLTEKSIMAVHAPSMDAAIQQGLGVQGPQTSLPGGPQLP